MCTGMDSTEESERMDVFSKEDFVTAKDKLRDYSRKDAEATLKEFGDLERGREQESNQNTEVAEKIVTLGLLTTMLQAVEAASVIGKEGVHTVARALLMFPLEGPSTPETKKAITDFIQQEAKRLVAGALKEQEQEEAQGALAGN